MGQQLSQILLTLTKTYNLNVALFFAQQVKNSINRIAPPVLSDRCDGLALEARVLLGGYGRNVDVRPTPSDLAFSIFSKA